MRRHFGLLNHSLTYPSNIYGQHSVTSFSDLTYSHIPNFSPIFSIFSALSYNSSQVRTDDSIQTVFDSHNTVNNPAIDTPDELLNSEPSLTNFSQPIFVPKSSPTPFVLSTS